MAVVVDCPSVADTQALYNEPDYLGVARLRIEARQVALAVITPEFTPGDLPGL